MQHAAGSRLRAPKAEEDFVVFFFFCLRRGGKIKAVAGGTCGLTIQLGKLSSPCHLNTLAQNFNRARLHNYVLTL